MNPFTDSVRAQTTRELADKLIPYVQRFPGMYTESRLKRLCLLAYQGGETDAIWKRVRVELESREVLFDDRPIYQDPKVYPKECVPPALATQVLCQRLLCKEEEGFSALATPVRVERVLLECQSRSIYVPRNRLLELVRANRNYFSRNKELAGLYEVVMGELRQKAKAEQSRAFGARTIN